MKAVNQLLILGVVGGALGGAWAIDLPARIDRQLGASEPSQRSARRAEAPKVIVRRVAFASDAAVIQAVGTGKALKAVALFPEAAGRVTEVLFEAGDSVDEGDPLLKLDSEEERLAVRLANVNLDDARETLKRYEGVASGRAVSRNQLENARKLLSQARIQLAQAELALRRRTLSAPFDGEIGIPKVQKGDRVTKTTQVATLDDRSALLVDFEVPAALAFGVDKGSTFEAVTWARRGEVFTGTVTALGSRIDQDTRTLQVRARIDNQRDRLRPGMAFSITLPLSGRRYPSVPSASIRWQRKGAYVWTVRDGAARRVPVEVIKRNEGWVLVDAKLNRDDLVVVEGVQRLRPGRKVRVERRDAAKAGTEGEPAPEPPGAR